MEKGKFIIVATMMIWASFFGTLAVESLTGSTVMGQINQYILDGIVLGIILTPFIAAVDIVLND